MFWRYDASVGRLLEGDIQRAICDYLAAKRHFFWRNNSYGIYDTRGGFHRPLPKHSMRGTPDIIVIREGRAVFLEVKGPKGRLSPDQAEFARCAVHAGADYHIVRSISDVMMLGL